jgi:hypothetical protein
MKILVASLAGLMALSAFAADSLSDRLARLETRMQSLEQENRQLRGRMATNDLGFRAYGPDANPPVTRQPSFPGTAESGNVNVSGTARFGRIAIGTNAPSAIIDVRGATYPQGINIQSASLGLVAVATNTSGTTSGGNFFSYSGGGRAIYARNQSTTGDGPAVLAQADSSSSFVPVLQLNGITGYGMITTMNGVNAYCYSTSGNYARGLDVPDAKKFGVIAAATDANSTGVEGRSDGSGGVGVRGISADSVNGYGVFATGRTGATGTKSMVIDHPADPANRTLLQYCAEGAEPLLIYRGIVTLDARGRGVAEVPSYFNLIAKDPSFALTAMGAAMPNLHVGSGMQGSRFVIAGGAPNQMVSWTVYARRWDPFTKKYPSPTEIDKADDQVGKYYMPELFNQPVSKRIGWEPSKTLLQEANAAKRP